MDRAFLSLEPIPSPPARSTSTTLPGLPDLDEVCQHLEVVFKKQPDEFPLEVDHDRRSRLSRTSSALGAVMVVFMSLHHSPDLSTACRQPKGWFRRFGTFAKMYLYKKDLVKSRTAAQDARVVALGTDSVFKVLQSQVTFNYDFANLERLYLSEYDVSRRAAEVKEYLLRVLVLMILLTFPPSMGQGPDLVGLKREANPATIANMLKNPMPAMPAKGRWQNDSDWADVCEDLGKGEAALPVHSTWCVNGSPLTRVAVTYVWSMGLMHAHHAPTHIDPSAHFRKYSDLISSEKLLMSAYRTFVGEFLGQLEVHCDMVTTAQTKLVGGFAAAAVACGSFVYHHFFMSTVNSLVHRIVHNVTEVA